MAGLSARAAEFGLTEKEFRSAEEHEQRQLNELEAAVLGAMWSEHCSYKSSRPLFRAFPTEGPQVLQGPGENAGVVDIGEGWALAFKVESHNRPSAVEPVQGAATGVGGILRDIFAMGARPVAVLNSLRFGEPDSERTQFLLNGVIEGIAHYGNKIGVPTVGGEITFHPSYAENPLVNVMALGLMRHEQLATGTLGRPGNRVIYAGSRTGRDGTGGAVFSSAELSAEAEHERPAVQAGDPFLEKILMEATLEAIEVGLVAGVQDMGAAGLLSSTSEMAYRAGLGTDLHLDLVPVREAGMQPWELILSESQERMILVPVPGREQELIDLLERWELDWADIGEVADHGRYRLYWHGELVCDLDVSLLNEAPLRQLEGREDPRRAELVARDLSGLAEPDDYGAVLLRLLASPTIASKHAIFERFDQQALNNTVTLPGAADAAVLRIPGSNLGVAAAIDCNPRWVALDPYRGAAAAVAEAARNVACTGATPLALTNNLNFGNPERPEVFHEMQEAVRGIADAARVLDTPVTGGNVSLNNQYLRDGETTAILPTPTIGVVGVLPDISLRADMHLPDGEADLYLLGRFRPVPGGSTYLALEHGLEAGEPPEVDLRHDLKTIEAVLGLIRGGHTATAHDLSDGGLAVALAELAVVNGRGFDIDLPADGLPLSTVLFGEGSGLVLVAVTPENRAAAEEYLERLGVWWQRLGRAAGDSLHLQVDGRTALDVSVSALKEAYEGTFTPLLTGWTATP